MSSKLYVCGIVFVFLLNYVRLAIPLTNTGLPTSPVEIKSVEANTSVSGCTNVTVTFISTENIEVLWTIDEGYIPEDLNAQVERYDYQASREKNAAICLPADLKFETVRLHLICEKHSFELHVDLHVTHNMPNTREDIKQYILLVPQSTEIGISSRGEARFHVMVDTSGTQFMFGMLQTQVTMLQGANVQHDSAYSFLPDDNNKRVRLRQISSTENEYHADIVIKSNILPTSETMITVLAACTHPLSMIQRLDMKQVRYLKRQETGSQPVAIIDQHDQTLQVIKRDNALMRCKAFGYPRPNIALYRTNGVKREPYTMTSYTTSLQFEKTTVFQLLNATDSDSGKYICKAFNANTSVEKGYTVKVVS